MIMGLQFVTTNGRWWFNIINAYGTGDCLLFIIGVQTYAIVVSLGFTKLNAIMLARTREKVPLALEWTIKYLTLPMLTLLFIFGIYNETKSTKTPEWTRWYGRIYIIVPIMLVVAGYMFPRKSPSVEALVAH